VSRTTKHIDTLYTIFSLRTCLKDRLICFHDLVNIYYICNVILHELIGLMIRTACDVPFVIADVNLTIIKRMFVVLYTHVMSGM